MTRLFTMPVVFVLAFALGVVTDKYALLAIFTPKPVQAPAATFIKEMRHIAEWASLTYYYTDVVAKSDQKEFLWMGVPGTAKKFIFRYDGVIKLGVDASKITVEEITVEEQAENPVNGEQEPRSKLRIILPPMQVLSHETKNDTVAFLDQSSGIFTSIKLEEPFNSLSENTPAVEQKALTRGAEQARISMENQLTSFLEYMPAVKEKHYIYEFVWTEAATTPEEDATPADNTPPPADTPAAPPTTSPAK
jgi:hypothetical protein